MEPGKHCAVLNLAQVGFWSSIFLGEGDAPKTPEAPPPKIHGHMGCPLLGHMDPLHSWAPRGEGTAQGGHTKAQEDLGCGAFEVWDYRLGSRTEADEVDARSSETQKVEVLGARSSDSRVFICTHVYVYIYSRLFRRRKHKKSPPNMDE